MSATERRGLADELAEFAARTGIADLPEAERRRVRLLLLDTVGVLAGGLRYPQLPALLRELGGDRSALWTVLGAAATWLDADSGGSFHPDGARLPPVPTAHPAPHVAPVLLLAAADGDVADGRLLDAFTAAVEVGLRCSVASSLRIGMHPHGVFGPGSAALAHGMLTGLEPRALREAFALATARPAATALSVPMGGGTVRNLWTGAGVLRGVLAAESARAGAAAGDGTLSATLDGVVATGLNADVLLGGLGERWETANSYLKPYACARWIHPTLDAVRLALADGAPAGEIVRVEVETFAFAASLDATAPESDMHARFSLPYCVAAYLRDGSLTAASFLPEGLARSEVAALAARVELRENPGHTNALPAERPSSVRLYAADGRCWSGGVRTARGNPDTALSGDEVVEKFRHNCAGVVSRSAARRLAGSLSAGTDDGTGALTGFARELLGFLSG